MARRRAMQSPKPIQPRTADFLQALRRRWLLVFDEKPVSYLKLTGETSCTSIQMKLVRFIHVVWSCTYTTLLVLFFLIYIYKPFCINNIRSHIYIITYNSLFCNCMANTNRFYIKR